MDRWYSLDALKKLFRKLPFDLVAVLFISFLLRILLSSLGSLELDFNTFRAWSDRLVGVGPGKFYEEWSDYLPGYLYILWLLGKVSALASWFPETLLYKLPAILADIGAGVFIYLATRTAGKKLALLVASLYLFNPAVIANSTLWGQVDSLTALSIVGLLFFVRSSPGVSSIALALGTLVKPQTAFIAVLVGFLWLRKFGFYKTLAFSLLSLSVFVIGFIPFLQGMDQAMLIPFSGGKDLIPFILDRLFVTANQYPYTSVNAFNFWAIFGMWKSDSGGPQIAGIVITAVTLLIVALRSVIPAKAVIQTGSLVGARDDRSGVKLYPFLQATVILLVSFLFLTRMHERHLLPVLAPLVIVAVRYPVLFVPYILLSITYVLNLQYSFVWINENFKQIFSQEVVNILSLVNIFSGALMVMVFLKPKNFQAQSAKLRLFSIFKPIGPSFAYLNSISNFTKNFKFQISNSARKSGQRIKTIPFIEKHSITLLVSILSFALLSRLAGLWYPGTFYFDEVYHAFTAREIVRGNPAAWEWLADPPEGFAYEWTHPPLAKLGMVAGMLIFREHSFAWRIPGALFGTLSVLLVYLLAVQLFKNKTVGIFSAGVFALDGLPLVMSRIGMNDSYFLFFALLAILFFLKQKYFFSSVFLGLAAASKWTTLWVAVLLFVAMVVFRQKPRFNIFWFLIVPPIVYMVSYIPFFLTGHTADQFIELQRQMWWYHTNLTATHSYQSPALSWPFDLRPVWLFVERRNDWVANIYILGNPLVFWLGLIALATTFITGILKKNLTLLFVVCGWGLLFLPWSLSPRAMFLYHYLPAVSFLSIATGWFLSQQNKKFIFVTYLLLLISYLFFFPHWTGIFVPEWFDNLYYIFPSWR